jgi:hypothetical protein
MQTRRSFVLTLAGALVALGVTAGSARAAEVLKGHVKSVAANLKTFVVTQLGTNTDLTVQINPQTQIVTTEAKKLDVKELKAGDGVAVSHVGGVASKIVVSVRTGS